MNKLFYIFSIISFYATCMQKPDESFYDSLEPIVDTTITPSCYEHIPSNSSYSSFDEISFSLTRSIPCSPEEDEPFSEVITIQSISTQTLSLASCSTAPKVFICKALGCKKEFKSEVAWYEHSKTHFKKRTKKQLAEPKKMPSSLKNEPPIKNSILEYVCPSTGCKFKATTQYELDSHFDEHKIELANRFNSLLASFKLPFSHK